MFIVCLRSKWPIRIGLIPVSVTSCNQEYYTVSRSLLCNGLLTVHVSPSQATPSIKFTGTHLYYWVEKGTVIVSVLPKNTTQCPQPGLQTAQLDWELSLLIMRPARLRDVFINKSQQRSKYYILLGCAEIWNLSLGELKNMFHD